MATTVQQVLDAAYGRSKKNDPGVDASETGELLPLVKRSMYGIFALAARVNPTLLAASEVISPGAGGWSRPSLAELVWRIEGQGTSGGNVSDGDKVIVVPQDDLEADTTQPAVYRYGGVYYPAGNANDPNTTDELEFFYAKRPEFGTGDDATADTLDDELDPLWPEFYNDLVILDVAIYLALKDDRRAEVGALRDERDHWARLFIAFLEHETANVVRRKGKIRRFTQETLVPISELLAGGSSLEV